MSERVLGVGVAGLGEAATEFLPAYSRHRRVRLVAAADSRQVARDRFVHDFPGARAYGDIADLCADPDIDVVVVATNHEHHVGPTVAAAAAGKHVVVEKPMALSLEDCDTMIQACERAGVILVGGHNHSYDAPVRMIRDIIRTGDLGRLRMVNSWNFNDFMVRPYPAAHLEASRGVVLNQGAHHVDVVRLLGGGMVRSVRAMTGGDGVRPGDGSYCCWLEFEDGTPCTLVYSGYGFFDTAELFGWVGEGGQPRQPGAATRSRRNFYALDPDAREDAIADLKERLRYGNVGVGERPQMPPGWEKGGRPPGCGALPTRQPFFGLTLVSCEGGDIRQSPDGLVVYSDEVSEIDLDGLPDARHAEIDELYAAVVHGVSPIHDGRWSKASIEVCLALLKSADERREVLLEHQVPVGDG